jgi:hypothetical protein
MAKNTGKGFRIGSIRNRVDKKSSNTYRKIDTNTGKCIGTKIGTKHKNVAQHRDKRLKKYK